MFIGHVQSFGFILSVYECPGELDGKSLRARRSLRGNKKRFGGTAEAGALPKSSRAFVGRSARPGRVGDPSLHNLGLDGSETRPYTTSAWTGQRPVPTQPLETRPYAGKLAGEANVPMWTGVLLRQETGPFAIFKVVFIGYIQSFGFILSVYECPGEVSGRPSRARRSGSKQERLGGAAGIGCGKTRESRFPSTPRKSPHPFAKNAKEWDPR